jgi:histidinol-phosphate/aromatic aminotransferase/cobyric acid decarboxylase-like protein
MDPISIALGLAQLAPIVAGWFGGSKAQDNAQKVVDIASRVLPGTQPDQLVEALKANPDKLLEFQKAVAAEHTEIMKAVFADIQNARAREVAVGGWANPVLAAVIVAGFLGTVFMVLAGYVEGLKDPLTAALVGTLIGYVSAKADQVTAYYFGSTAKSAAKDSTIQQLAGK